MINFQDFKINKLDSECFETIYEFERLLSWATDRLGLTIKTRYELNWGVIILLMSAYGKIDLLQKIGDEHGIDFLDESLHAKWNYLKKNWADYLDNSRQELEAELNEQFNKTIISNLSKTFENRIILNELHNLEYFFSERDTVELFIIGSDYFFTSFNFKDRFKAMDNDIKDYIFNSVVNTVKGEYTTTVLKTLSISCLPSEFWWRHINWI